MKKILAIALSLLLLVNLLPMNIFVNAADSEGVGEYELTEANQPNLGVKGTENNPIILYVGETVTLKTHVLHQAVGKLNTKWVSGNKSGNGLVATFDTHLQKGAEIQETHVTGVSVGKIRIKMRWKYNTDPDWEIFWRSECEETQNHFYITVEEKPIYKVTFMNEGAVHEVVEYEKGSNVVNPTNPTKAATDEFTYTFSGWTPAFSPVIKDVTYYASYSETKKQYTIT